LASFEKDYTGMHGQQNIKKVNIHYGREGREEFEVFSAKFVGE